jgi:hypothetical protein
MGKYPLSPSFPNPDPSLDPYITLLVNGISPSPPVIHQTVPASVESADTPQYFIIFLTADLISIVLQAVGGAQASQSASSGSPTQTATNIMVAGIIFQLISMVIFVSLGLHFIIRATRGKAYEFRVRAIAKGEEKRRRSSVESDATSPGVEKSEGEERTEAKDNLGRWWILLGAVLFASAMIIMRGESSPSEQVSI